MVSRSWWGLWELGGPRTPSKPHSTAWRSGGVTPGLVLGSLVPSAVLGREVIECRDNPPFKSAEQCFASGFCKGNWFRGSRNKRRRKTHSP